MYKEILRSIDGIEIYPIISLLLFTLCFGGVLWYTFSLKREEIKELSDVPLND